MIFLNNNILFKKSEKWNKNGTFSKGSQFKLLHFTIIKTEFGAYVYENVL